MDSAYPIALEPLPCDLERSQVGEPPREPFESAGFAVQSLEWDNRPVRRSRFLFESPDPRRSALQRFRERHGFEAALEGGGSEFERILRLRDWVHRRIPYRKGESILTAPDASAILDLAAVGGSFWCTHYALVTQACLTCCGWVSRHLGIDWDHSIEEGSTHHGVNDVFVNEWGKWVALDSHYNVHYERDGVPLSAWEIANEYVADGGRRVDVCVGLERKKVSAAREFDKLGRHESSSYFWCCIPFANDPFAPFGSWRPNPLVVLVGEAHRGKVWYQGGKGEAFTHKGYGLNQKNAYWPHSFLFTRREADVYPDLGTCHLMLDKTGHPLTIKVGVGTCTPAFDTIMASVDALDFHPVDLTFDWYPHEGENVLRIKTRNAFGVCGKEASIRVTLTKKKE